MSTVRPDATACTLLASNFDDSCESGCVGVPIGGNICDPCHVYNPEGALFCPFTALSTKGAAAFHAILDPAIAASLKADSACDHTGVVNGSCPTFGPVGCVNGKCVLLQNTGDDGDDDDAGHVAGDSGFDSGD